MIPYSSETSKAHHCDDDVVKVCKTMPAEVVVSNKMAEESEGLREGSSERSPKFKHVFKNQAKSAAQP